MKEYPKIETLLNRDSKTFKVIEGKWRLPEFEFLARNQWEFTEKVDGTNVRVMYNGTSVQFGGKTDNAQMPTTLILKLQEIFPISKFHEVFGVTSVCLYGEGYGAKIQKGGGNYKADGVDFTLFDILIDNWWLKQKDVRGLADKLGIAAVPFLGTGTLEDAIHITKAGIKSKWDDFLAEGLVVRPLVDLYTRAGQRIIGKIKTRDFGI